MPFGISSPVWVVAAPFGYGCGVDGSTIAATATPLHAATSAATVVAIAATDGSTLSIGNFGFLGGMISSGNNHGGC